MGRLHRIKLKGYSKKKWHFNNLNLIQILSIKMIHQVSEAIALVSKHKLLQFIGDSHVWGAIFRLQCAKSLNLYKQIMDRPFRHFTLIKRQLRHFTLIMRQLWLISYHDILWYHITPHQIYSNNILWYKMNNFWNPFFYGGKIEFQFRGHHLKWWMKCEKVK